ncbi:TlpA family protein disulfide reductase [Halorhodospira halophila]|uniref:Redoxin domain protein n=1 Tax=Halorhodospira halophila (strain DSM 244 / SL1) TaxID=349124 RepID=A1WXQ5_HALHL|nr:TlpA family protein disulfide reductase [Halorhodospira halophila]ABM62467.1 Redoxin domain protein [Halorhodospira halophila SL1]MBK1729596.1 thiol:disulfide interchange protein [Halorhodospira halophila]
MSALNQTVALGPLVLSIGQILLILALVVALIAGGLAARRSGVSVSDSLFSLVLVGLVGARVLFVFHYWESFESLWGVVDIRDGGFDPVGGVVAGLAYLAWRFWRSPQQRRALVTAVVAGGIVWGVTAGPLLVIDQQSRSVPDVAVSTLEGEHTDLPALIEETGKPVVVNLWATWCPACQQEKPVFEQAQEREDGVKFVFVNQGEDAGQVQGYLEEHAPSLDNILMDPHQRWSDATGTRGLPATFFYDEQGQLVDSHTGQVSSASLESGLERLR